MNEIRFRLGSNLSEKQERQYLERIAYMITGRADIFEKDSGYRWQLGTSNDWWMGKDYETGEYILAYRYGIGTNEPKMKALRVVLMWLLGLEDFNQLADRRFIKI